MSSHASTSCRRSRRARCTRIDTLWRRRWPGRLIAKKLVEVARLEGATAIAHGCAMRGNDQVRLEIAARALDPSITVIAPAREWGMTRAQEIEYARARHIQIPSDRSPYSTDANLWGRSIARGVLEDPSKEPPDDIYLLTRSPQQCPDEPAYIEIEFEAGVPLRANGIEMPLVELIESIETIAGAHGVGRIDMVENPLVGTKSREIYEAPTAVVLHMAHAELETLVVPRDLAAPVARAESHLRRPRLQRPVVLADARGDRRVRRQSPAARDRFGQNETLQRRVPRRRAPVAPFASRPGPRRADDRSCCRSSDRQGAEPWRISGPAGSKAIPTPSSLPSARHSASIAASSRTTCRGAWRGRRRWPRPACSQPKMPPRSTAGCRRCSSRAFQPSRTTRMFMPTSNAN